MRPRRVAMALVLAGLFAPAQARTEEAPSAAEVRVVEYLMRHVRPGEPVVASTLYNEVFTSREERAVLDRLFATFFKLPLAIAQHQKATGRPPTLAELSAQFRLAVPGEAALLLRIMESDPRVPRFLERDATTGEIVRVDVAAVLAHPRFGRAVERSLAGLEGRPAPTWEAVRFEGGSVRSDSLAGTPHVVYFWFSGCPPCVRTTPLLADLQRRYGARGLTVVALNADRVLEVPAGDAERASYTAQLPGAVFAHATPEIIEAHASVSVFPTFFFVDRRGRVVRQLVNFQEPSALEQAARSALE